MEKLNNKNREGIFSDFIYPSITKGVEKEKQPTVHILGGQPSAGKSHFIKVLLEKNKNLCVINGDDFRGYHPLYNYFLKKCENEASDLTQQDINYWIEKAIDTVSDNKYSIIIEGTMKNINIPLKTAQLLKNKGYMVYANVILINPEISKVDALKRYVLQKKIMGYGRFTKTTAQQNTVTNIMQNILKLNETEIINNLQVFYREIELFNTVYDRNKRGQNNIKIILENIQKRELTKKELEYLEKSWKIIEETNVLPKNDIEKIKNENIKYNLQI